MTPPRTKSDAVVDTLHGVAVADPYRWLEPGDDPEVQRWVAEQNLFTRAALDAIPER
jgi:prolyl oligopeptidase